MLGVGNVTHAFLRHNFAAVGGNPDGTTAGLNSEALKGVSVICTSSIGSTYVLPGFVSRWQPISLIIIDQFAVLVWLHAIQ